MPIYEFYCGACHTVFNFLSRRPGSARRPACPRCARQDLERRPSAFAISKGRKEDDTGDASPDLDDARLERAMASIAQEAEGLDENDPRQAAQLMRRLYDTAGLPIGSGMAEALQRMEAGEDPEAVEADLGDALEEDPLSGGPEASVKRLRRKYLPPAVDSELYEM